MAAQSGRYSMNGHDLGDYCNIDILDMPADMLALPDAKQNVTYTPTDANGIDIDLSAIYVKDRNMTFRCLLRSDSTELFYEYMGRLSAILLSGAITFVVASTGRTYTVRYLTMTSPVKTGRLDGPNCGFIFNLNLNEPIPNLT